MTLPATLRVGGERRDYEPPEFQRYAGLCAGVSEGPAQDGYTRALVSVGVWTYLRLKAG